MTPWLAAYMNSLNMPQMRQRMLPQFLTGSAGGGGGWTSGWNPSAMNPSIQQALHGSPGAGTSGGLMTPGGGWPWAQGGMPQRLDNDAPQMSLTGGEGQAPWLQQMQNQLGQFRNSMETWEGQRPAFPTGGFNQGNFQPFFNSIQNWLTQRPGFNWMPPSGTGGRG